MLIGHLFIFGEMSFFAHFTGLFVFSMNSRGSLGILDANLLPNI